jgi:DNA-binding response OmpR family regulator
LTEAECQLVEIMLAHAGKSVSRETLCNAVLRRSWSPGERSLDVHVSNLRRKLEQAPQRLVEIQSMRGVGYRLMVKERDDIAHTEPTAKSH